MSFAHERVESEDAITFRLIGAGDPIEIAHFVGGEDLMEGHISEGNVSLMEGPPHGGKIIKMASSDIIALARWLLAVAERRRDEELQEAGDAV